MKREGYSPAFIAAIIASALHHRRPGAAEHHRGGLWRGRQRLDRWIVHGRRGAGLMIGFGLMIYCYFFGLPACRKPRAPFRQVAFAAGDAALPLMISGDPARWHPHRLVHADRSRRGRGGLDHRGGDPALNRGHLRQDSLRLLPGRVDLLAAADHHRRRPTRSAGCWLICAAPS